jgi:prepilin-type N-terminal cleavage/methylation domain-containing protein
MTLRDPSRALCTPVDCVAERPKAAFTLIELMIVIAIMAVVMSLSIPTFYRSLERDTIRQATQKVLDACSDARTQAILNGRPCDLLIRPQEGTLSPRLASDPDGAHNGGAGDATEPASPKPLAESSPKGNASGSAGLPPGIAIVFIGVNFVPDLQTAEEVPVRFYPNGTGDEFTMLIRSDQNEWRKFTMDVATGIINWEVVR